MPTKPKFFYGWIIVLSSFVILFISQAYTLGGLSVFDKEILREFGWTVGDYKLKGLITFCLRDFWHHLWVHWQINMVYVH